MSPEIYQKLSDMRNEWEDARKAARESRDKKALSELCKARKILRRAMRRFEEAAKNANGTADPELKKSEIQAYERVLKLERVYELEIDNELQL